MFILDTWEFKEITKMIIVKWVWNFLQLYSEIFEKWNPKKLHEHFITTLKESVAQYFKQNCVYISFTHHNISKTLLWLKLDVSSENLMLEWETDASLRKTVFACAY